MEEKKMVAMTAEEAELSECVAESDFESDY